MNKNNSAELCYNECHSHNNSTQYIALLLYTPLVMWCDCFWTSSAKTKLLSLTTVDSSNCNVRCNSTIKTELCGSTNFSGNGRDVFAYVYSVFPLTTTTRTTTTTTTTTTATTTTTTTTISTSGKYTLEI